MNKILPLISPQGSCIDTLCLRCNTEIKSGEGYAEVLKNTVKGFVCEFCYAKSVDISGTLKPESAYIFELATKG